MFGNILCSPLRRLFPEPAFDPITGTILTLAGAGVSAMGTLAGGRAAAQAGQAAQGAAYFTAQQQEQAAGEARAAGQRAALDQNRTTDYVQSKLQARAAASGGGADDPTVVGLSSDVAGRGKYDALMEMYKGENRAIGLTDQAMATRMTGDAALAEGEAKRKASQLAALGTIIGGAGSAFGQYNKPKRGRTAEY